MTQVAAAAPALCTIATRGRVVFINRFCYPDVSATSQMLFDLAQRLAEYGLDVHVVCSRQLYDDPAAVLPAYEKAHGVHIHRVGTTRFGRDRLIGRSADYASFYVTGAIRLASLLRAGDIVVAKTDPPLISIAAAAVARLKGAHLVNWLQDVFPEVATYLGANPLPTWLDGALKRARDRSLRGALVNVVLGQRMQAHVERCGVPRSRIEVIENWADESVEPTAADASVLRAQLGLTHKFVVGYSGNLGRAHEYRTILEAAGRMSESEVVFLMIGGGVKMTELRRAVEARALRNFIFLPYQPREKLPDALAAADVHLACLLPDLEGLIVPSKFYGILAAARPVVFIGDRQGEIARIVEEARCGAAIQTDDSGTLVRTLRLLRDNTEIRAAMGLLARRLFIDKYTVRRATTQWLQIVANDGRIAAPAGRGAVRQVE